MTATRNRRFPTWVYDKGEEPDPRFTLANERTFLAWIRTSLALIAAGVALEAFELPIQPGLRLAASLVLIVTGLLTPLQAWFGWMTIERSLRQSRPLPSSPMGAPLAMAASGAGVLILLGVLLP